MKKPEWHSALRSLAVLLCVLALSACNGGSPNESSSDDAKTSETSASESSASDSNGLTVEDILVGSGEEVMNKSALAMHYTGWLYDPSMPDNQGKKFDSSLDRGKPLEFILGTGRVIKGWDQGITGMRVGGKRRLIIPPELGYGQRGAGSQIPPNATLMFDIELVAAESVSITDHVFGEGEAANPGQKVSVHYTGWLYDEDAVGNKGEKFDSSVDRGNQFDFVLGQGRVISGWEIGVQGMKVGGKRTLVIPPSMAYGARPRPGIPANSTLVFDIELFEVTGGR